MEVLQAQALRAREEGDTERAITAWRALLRHHPEDWRLALELKRDLKAGLHYPDSDPQFRRAARSLPDAEWLAHYPALYAFHGEDLEWLDGRARELLQARPTDPRLHAIRGDVAAQRRDWAGAEAGFSAALAAKPEQSEYAFKRETARMYLRLKPTLDEPSAAGGRGVGGEAEPSADYPVLFLNLDRNPERAAELSRQFANSAPRLQRIPGVEGGRLTASAVRRLGADPAMRGTLGCFLSHAAAWEALVASADPFALIIEDDVIPLLDLPPSLSAVNLPPGFDLCFLNDRIAPRLDPATVSRFTIRPLREAMAAFHPEDNAPGGDGYLLSREGARKLLQWVEADGFAEDVDWRLIAYGLSPAEIAALPRPSHCGAWLDRLQHLVRRPDRLEARVLHPPLIRTVGVSSDREDENRAHAG